jgi:2-dehydro-3-deoxygalactonokinase
MLAEWVAVDWGTSNVRAWGINASGKAIFSAASDKGMGKLSPADYPAVLTDLLTGLPSSVGRQIDVLICGMAGARQGWQEAPYLEVPADLGGISLAAVSPPMSDSNYAPRILPGLCQKQPGAEDVMRGEETQLLGLSALQPGFEGVVIMPGTHSKWAALSGTRVERFVTAMTGELFEVLKTHSVLRHSFNGPIDGPDQDEGFEAGLDIGIEHPERLTGTLFKVRAGALLSSRSPAYCAGLLSGLLIGAEVGGLRHWLGSAQVPLIGGVRLCTLYARALNRLDAKSLVVDATDATLAGLKAARL